MNNLKSLVALVTGSGSGLGLATARRLASKGARVVGLDLTPNAETEGHVVSIKGDIRSEDDIKKALDLCIDADGNKRLHTVVNCAGVANAFKIYNFESKRPQRLEDFKDVIDINVSGTFNVIRLACGLMAENPISNSGMRGVIINTSSSFAMEGHEGQTGYCASQMAINAMTLPLARDLSSVGIRVVTAAVGFFATPLVQRCDSPELMEFIRLTTPCPSRLGEPDEFALLVEQIMENEMINGEVIRLDGANRWPERG